MTDDRQSRLLMQYVEALKRDPNAPVPRGLDVETATFARRLVQRRMNRRERIWQNVTSQLESKQTTPGGNPMQAVYTPTPNVNLRVPLTLVAAMVALILSAFVIFTMNQGPDNPPPSAAQIGIEGEIEEQQDVVTATPTATLTFTPTWTITPTPTFTPTSVPGGAEEMSSATPIPTLPVTVNAPMQPTALPVTVIPPAGMQGRLVQVVIAVEDIAYGTQIEANMLATAFYPEEVVVAGIVSDEADLIGRYVTQDVFRWQPIRTTTVTDPNENCLIPANYSYPLEIERGSQLTLLNIDELEVGLRVTLSIRVNVDEMDEPILTRLVEDAILFCIQPESLTFGIPSNVDRTQGILIRDAGVEIIVAPRSAQVENLTGD